MSNFNYIASFYDPLARFVFGNNMALAKKQFIERVKPGSTILVFGGGTGDILNDIFPVMPGVTIDFIEPSAAMIRIAKKKLQQQYKHRVNFIQGDQSCIKPGMHYDVVAIFFVLDMFVQQEALDLSMKINAALKNGGIWLFADFF